MVTGIIAYLGLDPKGGWHETEPYLVSKDTQYISEINVHVLNVGVLKIDPKNFYCKIMNVRQLKFWQEYFTYTKNKFSSLHM